jgi:hypothetical protein
VDTLVGSRQNAANSGQHARAPQSAETAILQMSSHYDEITLISVEPCNSRQ